MLIGCRHVPWNPSHPYPVDDGDVKNDDFQQRQAIKHDEIGCRVDCVIVPWDGWFPYLHTVHSSVVINEVIDIKKDATW